MAIADTKIILKNVTLSYPHFDKPQPPMNPQDKAKYSGAFVIQDAENLAKIKAAALAAATEKFGAKGAAMVTVGGKGSAIRNDVEGKYPEGSVYISARSESKPGMVYRHPGPDGKKPATVEEKDIREVFYPGAKVNVEIVAFAFDKGVNKGIGYALNSVQKWAEGDRLDGRTAAEDTFEADLNAEPADLAKLGIA